MPFAFEAQLTFDGDEMEQDSTSRGEPYIRFANVNVDTGYEVVDRTVMAFGDNVEVAKLLASPKRPVKLLIEDRGRTFVVVGRAA